MRDREQEEREQSAAPLPQEDETSSTEREQKIAALLKENEELQSTVNRQQIQLAASYEHERQLEEALNSVTSSTCWKMTWPLRYFISHCRAIVGLFIAFFAFLKREGVRGLVRRLQDKHYYRKRFPGKSIPAERFAPVKLLVKQAHNQPDAPLISIVVPLYNTPMDFLTQLIDSVRNQTYEKWELCLVDAGQSAEVETYVRSCMTHETRIRYQKLAENKGIADNTNAGIEMVQGEYIALLDHDDLLHPSALWYVAQAIAEQNADFIYTDEVTFEGDIDHKTVYHFKPDYMLDNLRSNNYICHLSVFKASLLAAAGGGERAKYNGSQDYDLYLRLTEQAQTIAHIPHLLYYWRSSPTSVASNISAKMYCLEAAVKALYAHYDRMGVAVDKVSMIPDTPGFYKTDYTIAEPKKVSILIPSCDHAADLEKCIRSIYRRTTYPNFEVLIIENNSREEKTFAFYEKLEREHDNLRVLRWQGKGFNYSALNNFGARYATGEYLLLLNNDTEVIEPRWMEEMVMYAQQKRIGCVGAKLLYPDGTIQHAGLGFGYLTLAAHMHRNFPANHPGYMGRLVYAHDVYGVTAACLMVRKDVYDEVGGLDESFEVAFNDVDFCVRVRKAGYQNLFTPFAKLYHYESKSRGSDEKPEKRARFLSEVKRFQERWKDELAAGDPCLNPNFDDMREDFSLKIRPLD
jgi:GT2 family glycosyltransferase